MALGTTSSSRICGGHLVTRLALSFGVDTSGMVLISIQELGITALGKMRIPRHVKPDRPEPTLGDVMRGLTNVQDEHHCLMVSLVAMMRHLGMDHPPFPSADPVVPPPSQSRNNGYDGVGPSSTHPGDTDDDDDDDDNKETKTKSEGSEE
ncbi:unnamed protein product [Lactuca saligna]|uniref:Uncharacterized protein n=1 Tax=Lactuca saligna TaxID=75948 RepID=A0AA35Z559_LACSI|nr:unnamed protein product [Lactuca saligna]